MDDELIRMIHLDFSASDVVNLPNLKEGERGNNIRPEHWVRPDVACLNKIINERGLCVDGLDKFVHTPEGMALLKRWATFPTAFT